MPNQGTEARKFAIFATVLVLLVGAGVGLGAIFFSPPKPRAYDRSSPDALLASSREMVINSEAERLAELLYTDSEGMREIYARLGGVLGSLQDLALAVNERFPKEVAELRAEAEAAAKSGRGYSLFQQLMSRRDRRQPRDGNEDRLNELVQVIAADPYSWLTEAEGRLTYTPIDDERVAVLWDGKPVFPPFGLVLRQDQERWSVVLPLKSIPVVSRYMPQTPDEYSIWASLIQMVDNVVIDLTADVRGGEIESLDSLARRAGEKAFIPMGMGMVAYERAMKDRRKREREAREQPAPDAGGG